MKNTYKIQVKGLFLSLAILFGGLSSLKGQMGKEWKIYQLGNFDFNEKTFFKEVNNGKELLVGIAYKSGSTQARLDDKSVIPPIGMFGKKLLPIPSDFTGDPMNPVEVIESNNPNMFYVTDKKKVYKATMGIGNISYEKIFDGNSQIDRICEVGKNVVIVTDTLMYVLDENKNIQHSFRMKGAITDMVEYNGNLIYSKRVSWAFGKVYFVNITTGEFTEMQQKEFSGNFIGIKLQNIDGELYATSDIGPGGKIQLMHYSEKDSSWINAGIAGFPEKDQKGRWIVKDNYPKNNLVFDGKLGRYVDSFQAPLEYVDINEADGTKYWQTYPGVQPGIVKTFLRNDTLFGFGPNAVWYLTDVNASVKSFSEVGLNMYPNPATGNNVYISGLQKPEKYTISDMSGKVVASGTSMGEIEISRLTPGIFVLYLPDLSVTTKLIRN